MNEREAELLFLLHRLVEAVERLAHSSEDLSRNMGDFSQQMAKLLALTATERATGRLITGMLQLLGQRNAGPG